MGIQHKPSALGTWEFVVDHTNWSWIFISIVKSVWWCRCCTSCTRKTAGHNCAGTISSLEEGCWVHSIPCGWLIPLSFLLLLYQALCMKANKPGVWWAEISLEREAEAKGRGEEQMGLASVLLCTSLCCVCGRTMRAFVTALFCIPPPPDCNLELYQDKGSAWLVLLDNSFSLVYALHTETSTYPTALA